MYDYKARLVRVIDGDTVELAVDLGFHVTVTDHFRLQGINTPELHSTNPAERLAAQAAKAALLAILTEKPPAPYPILYVKTDKAEGDKYGRWLVQIFVNAKPVSANDQMIAEGFAKPYYGGKKTPFEG